MDDDWLQDLRFRPLTEVPIRVWNGWWSGMANERRGVRIGKIEDEDRKVRA